MNLDQEFFGSKEAAMEAFYRVYPKRRPHKRSISKKKGAPYRRIILKKTVGDREMVLHATKGWRNYRSA